jgi:xanthine dehydrogenase molybdenum-binding subunit
VSNVWPFCVDYDNAIITVQQDGSVHLAVGVPDLGTGTSTTLPQMAAEVLGVGLDEVNLTFADTQSTPYDIGSHASRTCYAAGTAVVAAAEDARRKILEYAGNLLKVTPERLHIQDSLIYITGQELSEAYAGSGTSQHGEERKSITLQELAHHAHLHNKQFIGVGRTVPGNAPPWHAHFAEVEVDTETGQIKVIKVAAAHDLGKAINPLLIVEGLIEGGVLMGVGYATSEEICYDAWGRQGSQQLAQVYAFHCGGCP